MDQGDGMDRLITTVKDWSMLNGFMYVSKENKEYYHHAPTTLCPALYPRDTFLSVQELQPILNELIELTLSQYGMKKLHLSSRNKLRVTSYIILDI